MSNKLLSEEVTALKASPHVESATSRAVTFTPEFKKAVYRELLGGKNIRRLMKKYGLICPIRRPNPYRRMAREMQTNHVAPNKVNREFRLHGARKILLTDITHLFFRGGKCYLSVVMDAYTKEATYRYWYAASRKPTPALMSLPSVALSSVVVKHSKRCP